MSLLNAGLAKATDIVLAPFSGLPPLVGLSVASLVTAAVMLVVFKRTSNQARLAAVKRSIHAALFEIRLFNDDLRAIMRAQLGMLRHNATYLRLSLVPMLWIIVPIALVIAQLQFHYGYAPLQPGDGVLLKVQVRQGSGEAVSLEVPPEVRLDTPAVWLPGANEVVWRLRPSQAGRYDLRVKVGSDTYTKSIQVAGGVVRRSPIRPDTSVVNQFLYPSEPPLPDDAPVAAITIAYPEQDLEVFGWSLNWMVWYFGLSLIFAFVLRTPFGVTI
jgi:uncharacterized membrane protein (DUF106 family)